MKYRKKPVVIEAVQWTGANVEEIEAFANSNDVMWYGEPFIEISTLEGIMRASEGDYIIKGVQGEFYPCKPDIFAETYDLVESEA